MAEFMTPVDRETAKRISPITLAFVGDAVQSLIVRRALALSADVKPAEHQRLAAKKVSAIGQSELLERIEGYLTDEERDVFRRARNAKKPTHAKHATSAEYSRSTGIEAVIGYLYLTGEYDRVEELLNL
ncbi:MAG: Mini-ribonuclease 3 [Clostridia bacterium]|nr:Mini-ribonuclease 3 [Clostridia bacterium]